MKGILDRARGRIAAAALLIGCGGAAAWGLQGAGEPATFRPSGARTGVPRSLAKGETLLALFLQQLADSTDRTVCLKSDDPPEAKLNVTRSIAALDAASAKDVLKDGGYELSEEDYKGKKVLWVQKLLAADRQKGKIFRGGRKDEDPDAPGAPAPAIGAPGISLLVRQEGAGSRYIVTFETSSRDEAADAIAVLKAKRPR